METIKIIITDKNGKETVLNGFGGTSSITHDISLTGNVKTIIKRYALEQSSLHKVEITEIELGE